MKNRWLVLVILSCLLAVVCGLPSGSHAREFERINGSAFPPVFQGDPNGGFYGTEEITSGGGAPPPPPSPAPKVPAYTHVPVLTVGPIGPVIGTLLNSHFLRQCLGFLFTGVGR